LNRILVYPGTFDPIHNGHLDIAKRASKLFDELIFSVAENIEKNPLFSVEERIRFIQNATADIKNVKVMSTSSLIVNFAREVKALALIRGLRHVSDFEFEFQLAMMNYHLNPDIVTIFMMPDEKYIHLNSTVVKDVARLSGNIAEYVPEEVEKALAQKYNL
jgi:pantetheine-phosphate adenylyltransferase